jgi:hypothetical protein
LGNLDGTFQQPRLVVTNFGYQAGGWRIEKHPRFLANLRGYDNATGRRGADIVGFGDDGVWTAIGNLDGTFQESQFVLAGFGYNAGGWRVEKHPRFLANLTGVDPIVGHRRADIVGIGDDGVWTAMGNGDGTFQAPQFVLAGFGYNAGGWRVEKHPRFLADLTGTGVPGIVGFGDDGVWTSLGNGDGTFQAPKFVLASFGYNAGWRVENHPRFMAYLTDTLVGIVGFYDDGVWTALSNGDGTFKKPTKVLPGSFTAGSGWQVEKHPRFPAAISSGFTADMVGFGDDGVWAAVHDQNWVGTYHDPRFVLASFGYNQGAWRVEKHPRLLADLTFSGHADIIGFKDEGVYTALNTNTGEGAFHQPRFVLANFGYITP